jgi:hypothetical protein
MARAARSAPSSASWAASASKAASRASLLVVADFTYVPMTRGFGYTAFVVDAYAGVIPGSECSPVKDTGFVERALRHAVAFRIREGHPFDDAIHHSDAGSQPRFNGSSQHRLIEPIVDGR